MPNPYNFKELKTKLTVVHDLLQNTDKEYHAEIHQDLHGFAQLLTDLQEQGEGMWAANGKQSHWRLKQERENWSRCGLAWLHSLLLCFSKAIGSGWAVQEASQMIIVPWAAADVHEYEKLGIWERQHTTMPNKVCILKCMVFSSIKITNKLIFTSC